MILRNTAFLLAHVEGTLASQLLQHVLHGLGMPSEGASSIQGATMYASMGGWMLEYFGLTCTGG